MTTITISSGTTVVLSAIPNTTAYIVENTGTLGIGGGGIVSGLITVSSGGTLLVGSGGEAFHTVMSSGGTINVASGGTITKPRIPGARAGGPRTVRQSRSHLRSCG